MEEMIQNSKNNREVAVAAKRKEKLKKQQNECRAYDEKIAHLALAWQKQSKDIWCSVWSMR